MIPKVIFQTARDPLPEYVVEMFRVRCPEFSYEFYNDADCMKFFEDHPDTEFSNIMEKFHEFHDGAHKADLFRYYYLYKRGGIFIDSDAMVYDNLKEVSENHDFFSVLSAFARTIFQGILGSQPGNKIIYKALKHLYKIDPLLLNLDYYLCVKEMYSIVTSDEIYQENYRIKLYDEIHKEDYAYVIEPENNQIIFIHFWKNKTIPLTYP
jgi:mannosyltransferase OCH1-like enzyme